MSLIEFIKDSAFKAALICKKHKISERATHLAILLYMNHLANNIPGMQLSDAIAVLDYVRMQDWPFSYILDEFLTENYFLDPVGPIEIPEKNYLEDVIHDIKSMGEESFKEMIFDSPDYSTFLKSFL